jgi:hypothetical protein
MIQLPDEPNKPLLLGKKPGQNEQNDEVSPNEDN